MKSDSTKLVSCIRYLDDAANCIIDAVNNDNLLDYVVKEDVSDILHSIYSLSGCLNSAFEHCFILKKSSLDDFLHNMKLNYYERPDDDDNLPF